MTDLGLPTARALAVAEAYDRLSLGQRGRAWTTEELTLGFVGDVGDLAKLVMADAGTRDIPMELLDGIIARKLAELGD